MNDSTCPHCGADELDAENGDVIYACESVQYSGRNNVTRTSLCMQRVITKQAAEIERLEFDAAVGRQLTIWLRKGATITGSPTCLSRDVNGEIQGELTIKYQKGEVK